MKTYLNLWDQRFPPRSTVLTIGNFDGVHLGHRSLFALAGEVAARDGVVPVALTFNPHPLKLIFPERRLFLITPLEKKIRLMAECGLEAVVCAPFTREFADLSAAEFGRRVIVEQLGARTVIVGDNYTFGRDREGDVKLLHKLGDELGFSTLIAPPLLVDGQVVSSTRVREHIMAGEVLPAARLLGRYYSVMGEVRPGKSRGAELGFPTANIRSEAELYPREGVYAVLVDYHDRQWQGVVSIGYNPTFGDTGLTVEVHILDFARYLYGETIKITFLDRLRAVIAFHDIPALQAQIARDISDARKIFGLAKDRCLW
ncbi:MAG: bifunctional riboflavin kinase/FAD synthetase [Deltaproteobacteria bacterium]|nr:bifunctional riboflavin kinase/FAD synthetase [Candidatus Anaeroferrophillus wilburensis]MBN2888052.1 bifunctional riboflavin kinase/FAD synthetase [Deltaproteobacteria bacterium]